jgi:hypothetical protein
MDNQLIYKVPLGIQKTTYNKLFERVNHESNLWYKKYKYEYQFNAYYEKYKKPYNPVRKSDMCLADYLKSDLYKNRHNAKKKAIKKIDFIEFFND